MAIIQCAECGKEISSNAAACPYCGNPVPRRLCPLHVVRLGPNLVAAKCDVSVDDAAIGSLTIDRRIYAWVSEGAHSLTLQMQLTGVEPRAAQPQKAEERFVVTDETSMVEVFVKTDGVWNGGAPRCLIESISCESGR